MYRYAIFALVLCAAVVAEDPACPEVKAVDNFKYNVYARGKWYEYLRYGTSEETGKCSSTTYTPDRDHFKIKDCNVKNGKQVCLDAYGQLSPEAGDTGRIIYTSPYGYNNAIHPAMVNILDTDYDNYSIMYYCQYTPEAGKRKEIAWVLTRSKVISDDTKAAIEKFIEDSPILDSKLFKNVDLSEGACKFSSCSCEAKLEYN